MLKLLVALVAGILLILVGWTAFAIYSGRQEAARVDAANRYTLSTLNARALTAAIKLYGLHTGQLPDDLTVLTAPVTNAQGQTIDRFLATIPTPAKGWSPWAYSHTESTFEVSSNGDGRTVSVSANIKDQ
jgi:hypothetical protein